MASDLRILSNEVCSFRHIDIVRGIDRLAQRFVIELLTEKGSMRYLPQRGTSFMKIIRKALNEMDVAVAFAVARSQIKKTLRSEENANTPPDERFATCWLEETTLTKDTIKLKLLVKNRAGTTAQINTPAIQL